MAAKDSVVFVVVRIVEQRKQLIRVFRRARLARQFIQEYVQVQEPQSKFNVETKVIWDRMPPER